MKKLFLLLSLILMTTVCSAQVKLQTGRENYKVESDSLEQSNVDSVYQFFSSYNHESNNYKEYVLEKKEVIVYLFIFSILPALLMFLLNVISKKGNNTTRLFFSIIFEIIIVFNVFIIFFLSSFLTSIFSGLFVFFYILSFFASLLSTIFNLPYNNNKDRKVGRNFKILFYILIIIQIILLVIFLFI